MKLSRFVGATTRDVMRQVREALGPDALIVSNRRVDGGIEVVAAQEEPPAGGEGASRSGAQSAMPHPAAGQPAPAASVPASSGPSPSGPGLSATLPGQAVGRPPAAPVQAAAGAAGDIPPGAYFQPAGAALPSVPSVPAIPRPALRLSGMPGGGADAGLYRMPGGTPAFLAPAAGVPAPPAVAPAAARLLDVPGAAGKAAAPAAASGPRVPEAPPTPAPQPPRMPFLPDVEPPHVHEASGAAARPGAGPSLPVRPASSETAMPPAAPPAAVRPPVPPARPSMARMPDAPMPQAIPAIRPAAEDPMQAALDALRGSLESRMDGLLWGGPSGPGTEPVSAALLRSLLECGFSMPLVRSLLERLPAGMDRHAALAWARNDLVTSLPVLRDEEAFLAGGGVFALVGPTGVGKTTTLAKLAARCVAREGREQVAMLTTDMFRIGALEQLQIYGRLMGIPAHSVRDADELKQALSHLGNRRIILIDTTGISQRDRNVAAQAALLHAAGRPVRRLLVLNAASQGDTLDEVAHAYRNGAGEDVVGCIVTKLDEATRIAPALDTAIRHRLPIHYVSVGQKVPEDMAVAEPQELVDRALDAAAGQASTLYAPSEADLAALWRAASQANGDDAARRRQLLAAAVLRPDGGGSAALDGAIAWLEADAANGLARDHWRARSAGTPPAALESLCQAGLDVARREFPRGSDRYLLAMHGKTALKTGQGAPAATLLASLLMTDRGAALSAPVPQLMLPHGILPAYAQGVPAHGNAAEALGLRVEALQAGLDGLPQVHLFEAGTPTLWRELSARGAAWVVRGPGALRVVQDDSPTTLAAVSRDLGYLPAGQVTLRGHDEDEAPLDLWASGTEVSLPARGQEDLFLRMVCARLTDPATGKLINQFYGLTNLKTAKADASSVARWLLLHERARTAFRYMGHGWAALPASAGVPAMARQAAYAAQLGAACWQLAHAPQAAAALDLVQAVATPGRKLPGVALPAALLRGFAMLEIAA